MQNDYPDLDLVITNGCIMDPRSDTVVTANLGIKSGKITTITSDELIGQEILDASGLVVAPGFIDIHSHIDGNEYMAGLAALQGITTTLTGNCGMSLFPIGPFLDTMDQGFVINIGTLVGHSWKLRELVGLDDYTQATSSQISRMENLARQALNEGALGISLGIEYAPATTYKEARVLCEIAAEYDGFVAIHPRGDVERFDSSLEEIFALKKDTDARVHISHLTYNYGFGMLDQAIHLIEQNINEGREITCDSGAYPFFATYIGTPTFDPGWTEELHCSLSDLIISSGPHTAKKCTPELYAEIRKSAPLTVGTVLAAGLESEMLTALTLPYVVFSTDGAVAKEPETGHPQDSGTYPRILGSYVRDKGLLTLMEALGKSSNQVAKILNLTTKGWIGLEADADLVIFDADTIIDRSDYLTIGKPDLPPQGVRAVIVNGQIVARNGQLTGVKPGRSIRRSKISI